MKRVLQVVLVLIVAAAWGLPLRAQEPTVVREGNTWVQVVNGTLGPARNLKVSTELGSVTVRGSAGPGITYSVKKRVYRSSEKEARQQFQKFAFKALQKGDSAVLEGQCMESSSRRMAVEITVSAPRELASVKVDTQGGSVTVKNIAGRVDAQTGGGSITVAEIGGAVVAHTSGGSIDVGDTGGDLQLDTAGGSITIRSATGRVKAQTAGGSIELGSATQGAVLETAGGSIQVKQCGGELRASTAGGSVNVGDVAGPARLETSGGSISLGSAKGVVRATTSGGGIRLSHLTHGVVAKTQAGPVFAEFVAQRGNFTDSLLETSVGDVVVYLPPDLPLTVRAVIENAFGHSIRSDFPEVKVSSEGGDYGPREVYGQGAINGGGPLLKIHTTAGNIELRRGKQ